MGLVVSREEKSLKIRIEQDSLHFFLKIAVFFVVIPASFFSVKKIVQPFSAHREMVGDAGFFGQKVVDPSSTIKNLEDLLKKKTGDADVYYRLGWIYAKEKNWQKAIENFEAAVKYNPSLEGPYNNLGNIYFLTGNKAKAIENYKKSIELNPSRVDAHFNIGYIYYTQGKLKEASDEFRKVLELDPKNYKATVMLEKMVQ